MDPLQEKGTIHTLVFGLLVLVLPSHQLTGTTLSVNSSYFILP